MTSIITMLTCPNCGSDATATVVRADTDERSDVRSFHCLTGCVVDDKAVRRMLDMARK